MARVRGGELYLGIKGHVIAVDRATGEERWRTKLTGVTMRAHDFVHLYRDAEQLYASYSGEIFCLDPKTGEVRWHNKLSRLGTGIVSMLGAAGAGSVPASLFEEQRRRDTAASTAAAT